MRVLVKVVKRPCFFSFEHQNLSYLKFDFPRKVYMSLIQFLGIFQINNKYGRIRIILRN